MKEGRYKLMPKKEQEDRVMKAYELGKQEGKEEIIEKLIELLELDKRYASKDHGHRISDYRGEE